MALTIKQHNGCITYTIADAFAPDGRRAFSIQDDLDDTEVEFVVLPHQANALAAIMAELGIENKPLEI